MDEPPRVAHDLAQADARTGAGPAGPIANGQASRPPATSWLAPVLRTMLPVEVNMRAAGRWSVVAVVMGMGMGVGGCDPGAGDGDVAGEGEGEGEGEVEDGCAVDADCADGEVCASYTEGTESRSVARWRSVAGAVVASTEPAS